MAAAKLVTRCPACRTAFRLVADQLRLRQGLVRCGQCDTVFDAREHLIEVPAPASAAAPAVAPAPSSATPPVTMSAALAHAEQAQASARARENEAPFEPGFDPGYEVPALDSPTTMMSEPEPEREPEREPEPIPEQKETSAAREMPAEDRLEAEADEAEAEAEVEAEAVAEAQADDTAGQPVATEATEVTETPEADDGQAASAAPESEVEPQVEAAPADIAAHAAPEVETPLTEPPLPWPTLNHSAFDDEPARPPAGATHSSLDPAAAFAPPTPSGMPPYGAYSAKASWPPLRPTEAPPTRPMAPVSTPTAANAVPGAPEPPAAAVSAPASLDVDDTDNTTYATDTADTTDKPHATDVADVADAAAKASTAAWPETPAEALPTPEPFPQADPVPSASGFLRAEDPVDAEAEAWAAQARDVIEHDLGVTPRDGTPDAVARESTTRHWLGQNAAPAAGPVFAPDFLRHTREREQARAPRPNASVPGSKRTWVRTAAIVLGVGLLVQGVFLARSQIAGSMPVLRPVLEAACAPFGCEVPPWRDLDALRIDTSQLQKQDEANDVYQLAVTLRNQGRATTALPAIELVMTDLQDQLLLRRVLQPAEYLDAAQRGFAATGLRAGSELPVRVRFRTQQVAANYRVLIFYP